MNATDAYSMFDSASAFLIYFLMVLLIVGIIVFIFYWFSFKINVRLRNKTSTFDQIKDTKGKITKDKEGVEKLIYRVNFLRRDTMITPPAEAVNLDMKGRLCLEIEVSTDGSRRYIIKNTSKNIFEPFNTNDRVFHINETDKRLSRKRKTWGEILLALAPLLVIVIILGMLLGFWGDVVKPFMEMGDKQVQITEAQKEITLMLKEIIKKEQVIPTEAPPDYVPINVSVPE